MSTKDEALKLALEALKFALHVGFDESSESQIKKGDKAVQQHQNAITALREALAEQPAQQEPVALQRDVIVVNLVREGINKHRARELAEHFIVHTAPPAQRTWVGLTDEEKNQVAWSCGAMSADWLEFAGAIEAKLKEKNT